mgnify:CR=1 FL=1
MHGNSHVFSIEGLNLWYGSLQALKDISFNIEKKKITAIIGPSGCGKSTFLKVLNRMVDLIPSVKITGNVKFKDKDIFNGITNLVDLRTSIGMVFQKPNPFPKSIFDNVAYAPRIHGIKKKEELYSIVERSLKQAALWGEVKDRLNESGLSLSGGQQQRLCIARALAMEPEVVLMDEPTSALDPIATLKIEELVRDLRSNYHIVIVTHNMQQAARVSDKTAFFLNGELIEKGETDLIFTKPKDQRTEDYITGRFG